MSPSEYYQACKLILKNKFKRWIYNDRPFTARQLLNALKTSRVEMAALTADAGPKAIVDACMCRLLKEYSMSSAKGFNRILVKRLLHSFYCCVPAGSAAVPNITAMLSIDSADQSTTGFVLSNAGTVDGSTDITDNPDYTYKFTITIDSVDVFSITGAGGSSSGSWTFGDWHPNIVTNSNQAAYIAACTGTIDATGITIVDHKQTPTVSGLHAQMVKDAIVTYADFDINALNFGYTRECSMDVTINSYSASATAVTIPNIYAPLRLQHNKGSAFNLTCPWFHAVDLGDGNPVFAPTAGTGFSHNYLGSTSDQVNCDIWGLRLLTTLQTTGFDINLVGDLNFDYFILSNSTIVLQGSGLTGLTTNVFNGTVNTFSVSNSLSLAGFAPFKWASHTTIDVSNCPNLISIRVDNILRNIYASDCTSVASVNLGNITSILSPTNVYFDNCPVISTMNSIYASLEVNTGVGTGTITTNGSPTPTGGALNADVLSLQAKGYTVTL